MCPSLSSLYPSRMRSKLLALFGLLLVITVIYKLISSTKAPQLTRPTRVVKGAGSYIVSTHYSDQLTGSVFNLFSLQCWAGSLKMNKVFVVEPFIRGGSILGVNLSKRIPEVFYEARADKYITAPILNIGRTEHFDSDNIIRLRDIYSLTEWNDISQIHNYSPLVSWRNFVQNAPRNLILVDRLCHSGGMCMGECNMPDDEFDSFYESKYFLDSAIPFARNNNFEIVRKVCIDPSKLMTNNEFTRFIYGNHSINETTVLFNHWGGIERTKSLYRIPISDLYQCSRHYINFEPRYSSMLELDHRKYVKKFFPAGLKYISVMLRLEQLIVYHRLLTKSIALQRVHVMRCVDNLLRKVELVTKKTNIDYLFLAMDCGKHGSQKYRGPKNNLTVMIDEACQTLYNSLYGNTSTLTEWEHSFDSVASFHVPGYIALLQKNIAAGGDPLILAGGGAFQASARKLHNGSLYDKVENC